MHAMEEGTEVTGLARLAQAIESACAGPAAEVPAAVAQALCRYGEPGDLLLPQQREGSAGGYMRHLLYADAKGRFSVVALVWQAGQRTPVHAHYTWCAYRVAEGELREERFGWNAAAGRAEPSETVVRAAGDTSCGHAGYDQIHRLGNDGGAPAISIHVYGIDADRVSTHVNRLAAVA